MRGRLQQAGAFLGGMVVPNIGAFIAWGLLTALFIPSGWIPNEHLAKLVSPLILNLLPILIGFSGGRLVHGIRGGIVGATATMGVVVGSNIPMFIGAMIMGPVGGWLIKRFDETVKGKLRPGFEMLVNNFSAGIISMGLTLIGYTLVKSVVEDLVTALGAGAKAVTGAGLLPLIALVIEPGKVLFINNAINHGVLGPLGIAEAKQVGKSIFFLLEPNPGPGLGLLAAYWLFGKGTARHSSPAAMIIHFFGGIHEMYFPYVLMNPLTLLAMIAGSSFAALVYVATGAGLVATPSPGSIFAHIALAPKGGLLPVLLGIAAGAVVTFLVAMPIVSRAEAPAAESEPASETKARASPDTSETKGHTLPSTIFFVCEAGMGSSVMGSSVLQKVLHNARLDIKVEHAALSEIPPAAEVIIAHRSLASRVREAAPQAKVYPVEDFIQTPVYRELTQDFLSRARGTHVESAAL